MYFRAGHYYTYDDSRDAETMIRYAMEGGFRNQVAMDVPGEPGALALLLAGIESRILDVHWHSDPMINALLIGLSLGGVVMVGPLFIWAVCLLTGKGSGGGKAPAPAEKPKAEGTAAAATPASPKGGNVRQRKMKPSSE